MTVNAVFRQQAGTNLTAKPSGGTAVMTPTSLASGSYWQSAKLDFGSTFAQAFAVFLDVEMAATPTAGKTIDIWANPSSNATAGTDNRGGCSGTDAAYTGYSSNAAASVPQLQSVGSGVLTVQATSTVQKMFIGYFFPAQRYNSFVILNNGSGAAFHSSAANFALTFTPLEGTSE